MDFRKLRHASVLARFGSYVRAADELHMTQSALTRSVQALEAELGAKLFDRDRRGVRLTPVGRQLVDGAETILGDVRNLEREIGLAGRGESGLVRIGMGPLPSSIFLPGLLREAVGKPCVEVAIENGPAANLLESLQAERIEFCLCSASLVPANRKFAVRQVMEATIGLFVRPGHPLLARKQLVGSQVLRFPLVTGNATTESLHNLRSHLGLAADEPLPLAVACDDFESLRVLTCESDTVFLTSDAALQADLGAGRLRSLPAPFRRITTSRIVAVQLAGRTLLPAADFLLQKITAAAPSASGLSPRV